MRLPQWWSAAAQELCFQQPLWLKNFIQLHVSTFLSPAALQIALKTSTDNKWSWSENQSELSLADHLTLPYDLNFGEKSASMDVLRDLTILLLASSGNTAYIWSQQFMDSLADKNKADCVEDMLKKLISGISLPPALWAERAAKLFKRIPYCELIAFVVNVMLYEDKKASYDVNQHTADPPSLEVR